MTKFIASLFVFALLIASLPVQACPFDQQTTAQSTPVVTSDANGTPPPSTPAPTKTGS